MTLLVDIYTKHGKKKILVAKSGDEVTLIKDMGDMLIVQKNLIKISVKKCDVKE